MYIYCRLKAFVYYSSVIGRNEVIKGFWEMRSDINNHVLRSDGNNIMLFKLN